MNQSVVDSTAIKEKILIIREYYEQIHTSKLGNLKEKKILRNTEIT